MVGVMTSTYDFGEGVLKTTLEKLLDSTMKVMLIPFSFSMIKMPTVEAYDQSCDRGGQYFEWIAEQFGKLGILYSNIDTLHYYRDDLATMRRKICTADVLFLTGGLPDQAMKRLEEKGLIQLLRSFDGVVMGSSAGALIQLASYFCTPDADYAEFGFYSGLGLTQNEFYIEVHYRGADLLEEYQVLKEMGQPIYALPDGAGLIYRGSTVETIGEVVVFN